MAITHASAENVKTELGASTYKWSELITHADINKWSKIKPVRGPLPEGSSGKYGFNLPTNWDYLHPRGRITNSEPLRCADFIGYEHSQASAYPTIQCKNSEDPANSTIYPVAPEPGVSPYSNSWRVRFYKALSSVRITPADLGLSNYYFGIKISINGGTPWYKTFGNVSATDDSGTLFTVDASLRTDNGYYYYNLPYGKGTYTWTLFLSSTEHTSWTQSNPSNYIPFPADTFNGETIVSSGSFEVAGWVDLSDTNFTEFGRNGGTNSETSTVTFLGDGDWTVQSKPSWITVECWDYSGTPRQLTNTSLWHSGTIIKLVADQNFSSYRTGSVVISAAGAIASISVSQEAALLGVSYIWTVGNMETFTISNETHGMSVNSSSFDLSFDHTFSGDSYKYWEIIKQGYGTLASGSGNPGGIRLRTGITAVKAGTLSQAIADGDVIYINIGLSES